MSTRQLDALIADRSKLQSVLFPSTTETAIDDDIFINLEAAWPQLLNALVVLNPTLSLLEHGGADLGRLNNHPTRGFPTADVRRIAAALSVLGLDRLPAAERERCEMLKEFVIETAKAEAGMIVFWR